MSDEPRNTPSLAGVPVPATPRFPLLGVEVSPLSTGELNRLVSAAVEQNTKWIIANHNLHSIYVFHRDAEMRRFYAHAEHVHVDGMPLIAWGRLLGYPFERKHRVTYVDWIRPLMAEAARQHWRVFYLGSRPGVAERGASILVREFPGLELRTSSGFFDASTGSTENEHVLAQIRGFRPHILMVGMGMPRQERWILSNLERIEANVILNAGACIDYVAGAVPTPPRWMGRLGLEWAYRLASEPGRLWRRYLVEPFFLIPPLLGDVRRRVLRGGRSQPGQSA